MAKEHSRSIRSPDPFPTGCNVAEGAGILDAAPCDGVTQNQVIHAVHVTHGYMLPRIADHLGLHYITVSRIVKAQNRML